MNLSPRISFRERIEEDERELRVTSDKLVAVNTERNLEATSEF